MVGFIRDRECNDYKIILCLDDPDGLCHAIQLQICWSRFDVARWPDQDSTIESPQITRTLKSVLTTGPLPSARWSGTENVISVH